MRAVLTDFEVSRGVPSGWLPVKHVRHTFSYQNRLIRSLLNYSQHFYHHHHHHM